MVQVIPSWKQIAIEDLMEIVSYIADRNPDAAQALNDEIDSKTSKLPNSPKMYRKGRVEGTREMVVRPNYIVVYTENASAIEILRVLHTAQQWP